MKIRFLLAASVSAALALTGTVVSAAQAEETAYEADVGGGAAAIMGHAEFRTYMLRDIDYEQPDTFILDVTHPRVVMGKNGGSFRQKALAQNVAGVLVRAADVTVKGNRTGTPYAEARATLADVSLTGGALKGTKIGTIDVHCRWDRNGWVATTTIIDANGNKTQPAPNEQIDLPNELGFIRFNEQYVDRIPQLNPDGSYQRDANGRVLYAETVYVSGARVHLAVHPSWYGLDFVDPDLDSLDVYLGVASCDPLALPNLGGLKTISSAS